MKYEITPRHEIYSRISKLQKQLLQRGFSGALISQNTDLFYYIGTIQRSILYVPSEGEPVLAVCAAYNGIFNGLHMFAAQSALQIVQSATKLVGILVLLLVGLSLKGVFAANVAATVVTILLVARHFPTSGARASTSIMGESRYTA